MMERPSVRTADGATSAESTLIHTIAITLASTCRRYLSTSVDQQGERRPWVRRQATRTLDQFLKISHENPLIGGAPSMMAPELDEAFESRAFEPRSAHADSADSVSQLIGDIY